MPVLSLWEISYILAPLLETVVKVRAHPGVPSHAPCRLCGLLLNAADMCMIFLAQYLSMSGCLILTLVLNPAQESGYWAKHSLLQGTPQSLAQPGFPGSNDQWISEPQDDGGAGDT